MRRGRRLAMTAHAREALTQRPDEFDPRHFLKASRQGMRDIVAERMHQFGQAGHAADYEPIPLDEMTQRYAEQRIAS